MSVPRCAALTGAALCLALASAPAASAAPTCPVDPTFSVDSGATLHLQSACTGNGSLSFGLISGVSHGSLIPGSGGSADYTSGTYYSGPDQFVYTAQDADGTTIVTVHIQVLPVGAPPSCPDPVDVYVPATTTVTLVGNCADPDDSVNALRYALPDGPIPGMGIASDHSVTYTPQPATPSASFRYSATDFRGNTVIAHVNIHVVAANS